MKRAIFTPMKDFNPCNMYFSEEASIFGLPVTYEESRLLLLAVPWDLTCSFRTGTSEAPRKIYDMSFQIDLYDRDYPEEWKKGIFYDDALSDRLVSTTQKYFPWLEEHRKKLYYGKTDLELIKEINRINAVVFEEIQRKIREHHDRNKKIGIIGGEHSVTYNAVKVLAETCEEFSIVQIDAHADLREAYEGLEFSHASVMFNLLRDVPAVKKIINLGLRDYSHCEAERIKTDKRLFAPDFLTLRGAQFQGKTWQKIIEDFLSEIPTEHIYISFDIDGLDVPFCSGTGTPVPGGLTFAEAEFFLKSLVKAGKKIIGFDLVETASSDNNELNYIVATHLLYKLSLLCLAAE